MNKKKLVLIIIPVVIIAAIAGFCVWFFLLRGPKDTGVTPIETPIRFEKFVLDSDEIDSITSVVGFRWIVDAYGKGLENGLEGVRAEQLTAEIAELEAKYGEGSEEEKESTESEETAEGEEAESSSTFKRSQEKEKRNSKNFVYIPTKEEIKEQKKEAKREKKEGQKKIKELTKELEKLQAEIEEKYPVVEEEAPTPDPLFKGHSVKIAEEEELGTVTYVYNRIEDVQSDLGQYIKYLNEQGFKPEYPYYMNPSGYISLEKASKSKGFAIQVGIDYEPGAYTILLQKAEKELEEEKKEGSSGSGSSKKAFGRMDAIDSIKNMSPEILGLSQSANNYTIITDPGRTNINGLECYGVHVYNTTSQRTNEIVATYYVGTDSSTIYKYDVMSDQYTKIQ